MKAVTFITLIAIVTMGLAGCRDMDYSQMPLYEDVYPMVYPKLDKPKRLPRSQPYASTRGMPPTPQVRIAPPSLPPSPSSPHPLAMMAAPPSSEENSGNQSSFFGSNEDAAANPPPAAPVEGMVDQTPPFMP